MYFIFIIERQDNCMATVTKELAEVYSDLTGKLIGQVETFVVTDGEVTLYFSPQLIAEDIKALKWYCQHYKDEVRLNCNAQTLYNAFNEMSSVISSLDSNSLLKIIKCLPRWKNGNVRNAIMPLYITGVTEYNGDEGWARITSLELSLMPCTKDDDIDFTKHCNFFTKRTKIKNSFEIRATLDRQYNKKDIAIIDKNGKFNKLEISRKKYLKQEDLVPGHIYTDAKDKEFLYIGNIEYGNACRMLKGDTQEVYGTIHDSQGHMCIDSSHGRLSANSMPYVFLPLTEKNKNELCKAGSLEAYLKNFFEKQKAKYLKQRISSYEDSAIIDDIKLPPFKIDIKSLKVVADKGELFSPQAMQCDIEITVPNKLLNKGVTIEDYLAKTADPLPFLILEAKTIFRTANK